MRIVLCYPIQPRHYQQIAAVVPEAELVDAGQERVARELLNADLYCGHAKVPVDWDAVVRQGRLQWIQSSAAGMDHCLVPSVIDSDIVVTSASGVLADQVAEHTIALLTGWCRNLPTFFRAQQQKEFIRRPTRDLHRSTVGIVGLGGVGRRLAQVLSAFQTRILATDLFPLDKPDCVESLWPADRLEELAGIVDILVLCTTIWSPHSPAAIWPGR
jgi:phosphoglycerate dehydrogenase-like enzyme